MVTNHQKTGMKSIPQECANETVDIGFEAFATMTTKNIFFWDVEPHRRRRTYLKRKVYQMMDANICKIGT
jgi:hypothetical protein